MAKIVRLRLWSIGASLLALGTALDVHAQSYSVGLAEDRATIVHGSTTTTTSTTTTQTPVSTIRSTSPTVTTTTSTLPLQEVGCYGAITVERLTNVQETMGLIGTSMFSGPGSSMACLRAIVERCQSSGNIGGVDDYTDDCVGETLAGINGLNQLADTGIAGFSHTTVDRDRRAAIFENDGDANTVSAWRNRNPSASNVRDSFTSFIDENCNVRRDVPPEMLCSSKDVKIRWLVSPLSLVWQGGSLVNEHVLTQFPLDPSKSGHWFTWRASDAAPLLVFDPEHTGRITSAEQLFGTFSFGKRWANGFEALASLDADGDSEVSGEELDPLALWFDANRNGVSEGGEVYSVVESGVTALRFRPDSRNEARGELVASDGFTAVRDGAETRGAIVDWWSSAFATPGEALSAHAPLTKKEQVAVRDGARSENALSDSALSGYWFWNASNASDRLAPKGMFYLRAAKDGALSGASYVEVPLKRNSDRLRSVIVAAPLTGRVVTDGKGVRHVTFMVVGPHGERTESEAIVRGDSISGTSVLPVSRDSGNSLRYAWVAERQ